MDTVQLTSEQKHLVEELAVIMEKSHITPAAARIVSLLVVSDQTELTFDQIRDALNLSKSATSNAIRVLLHTHSLDYVTRPNDRKRYFRSCFTHWSNRVTEKFTEITDVISVLKKILAQRPDTTTAFNRDLDKAICFIEFVAAEMPALYQKWEFMNKPTNR